MEFLINHDETTIPNSQQTAFGLEIQPPLSEVAAAGVATKLAERADGFATGQEHLAEEATITRNDGAGTAFVVQPNINRRGLTSGDIAQAVAKLIDPCHIHKITYQPPLDNRG